MKSMPLEKSGLVATRQGAGTRTFGKACEDVDKTQRTKSVRPAADSDSELTNMVESWRAAVSAVARLLFYRWSNAETSQTSLFDTYLLALHTANQMALFLEAQEAREKPVRAKLRAPRR